MAKSNRDRIADVMDALKDGLGQFILREYKSTFKATRYLQEIELTLTTNAYSAPHFSDEKAALQEIDTQGWLNLIIRQWNDVFRTKLGHSERSYVSELLEARNGLGHQKPFTNEDAYRVADTATRLLQAINAPAQAEITQEIAKDLLRIRYEQEQQRSKKQTASLEEAPTTTQAGLKPWRFVVKPHPDVASGRYIQAEFAADLGQVIKGEASPEYQEPDEFFRRTFLTKGLVDLLANGLKRVNGLGGDPVIQLKTSFGGGKTHSMIALYHLTSGSIGLSKIPGGERIKEQAGNVEDMITANRAVIVGTAFSATNPRVYKDVTTNTLWGEIAYQLGGVEGYNMVKDADLTGTSPGSDNIREILEKYGPVLIVIDELIAFARNLYKAERLPAGTFDSIMTFMQVLTEGVRRSSDSILLISLPDSKNELGGEGGEVALNILSKTIGRVEAVWQPITANESFEVVRRRLFSSEIDYAARDAVLTAFRDMYSNNSGDYPSGVGDGEYYRRMVSAYPIHPELFDRLYQDWSTLERFQKTRGVLRLMASVIHELWLRNDQSLLIMPSSIALDASNVRNEVLRYLPDNWHAIVDTDIDGDSSQTREIDNVVPALGQYAASRRVARAIFVGSAPSVTEQGVRGLEEVRIHLATVQPGEPTAVFGDALRRMSNQLMYLYTDGSRYWYDTRPTVNRMARDRAQAVKEDDVYVEMEKRIRAIREGKGHFAGVHIAPMNTADVPDEQRARLVVVEPSSTHKRGSNNGALSVAKTILEERGNSQRYHRNMLIFVVADTERQEAWKSVVRDYLAWKSIQDEKEQLNLDAQQSKQVSSNLKRTDETVDMRLQETYSWLLVPTQPNPQGDIIFEEHRISGQESFYERAARKLKQSSYLIPDWSPFNLDIELKRYLWGNEPHLKVKKLWEYLSDFCYLPRLLNQDVLLQAISDGIVGANPTFGYATGIDKDGKYVNLRFGEAGRVYFDDNAVIVKAEVAKQQLAEVRVVDPIIDKSGKGNDDRTDPIPPPVPKIEKRYYGSVSINPIRVIDDIDTILEEVIQHLTSQSDAHIEIRLEIKAYTDKGFDEATVRTVKENSQVLKFDNADFEKE